MLVLVIAAMEGEQQLGGKCWRGGKVVASDWSSWNTDSDRRKGNT